MVKTSNGLYHKNVSNNSYLSLLCQKRGQYCFDPEVGLYDPEKIYKDEKTGESVARQESYVPLSEVLDDDNITEVNAVRDLRDHEKCDGTFFFDLWCSNGKRTVPQEDVSKHEVWVDISSTLKLVDPEKDGTCYRASALKKSAEICKTSLKKYAFNEIFFEVSDFNSFCQADGLNDFKKILARLRAYPKRKGHSLTIITDIYEADAQFINQIKQEHPEVLIHGIDSPIRAEALYGKMPYICSK